MFKLENGKPNFFIGKINEIGYTDNKDKELLIEKLKEENEDIELIDEEVIIDEEFKTKAIALGELGLTYSKSEFLQYLNGEKPIPGEEAKDLKLEMIISNMEMAKLINDLKSETTIKQTQMVMEMVDLINSMNKGGEK